VMVGEICGSMNLHFPIEHVAELRASLEGLL
jgi:hypothetical protein